MDRPWTGQRRRTPADTAALLAEMADRMSHSGRERVETWTDPGGRFAVGRVTPRELPGPPWPAGGGAAGGPRVRRGHAPRRRRSTADGLHDLARRGTARAPVAAGIVHGGPLGAARADGSRSRSIAARRARSPTRVAGSRLYFAPEVKALLAAPGVDKSLDEAVARPLPRRRLPAGAPDALRRRSAASAAARRSSPSPAASASSPTGATGSASAATARARAISRRSSPRSSAARSSATSATPIAPSSSSAAGVDSRSIAAAAQDAARRGGKAVSTVTWAAPDARAGSDRDVAQRVADALGTRHASVVRQVTAWGRRLVRGHLPPRRPHRRPRLPPPRARRDARPRRPRHARRAPRRRVLRLGGSRRLARGGLALAQPPQPAPPPPPRRRGPPRGPPPDLAAAAEAALAEAGAPAPRPSTPTTPRTSSTSATASRATSAPRRT